MRQYKSKKSILISIDDVFTIINIILCLVGRRIYSMVKSQRNINDVKWSKEFKDGPSEKNKCSQTKNVFIIGDSEIIGTTKKTLVK